VDGRVNDWRGLTTGLGGTWQYSSGELIYQDHLYDDLGADTRQRSEQHGNVTGAPMGDYRYPTDEIRYGHNAADLLELRLAADAKSIWILARMNTLKVKDGSVVAIAFDTDGRTTTGGGPWPYGAGLSVPGVDRVITLWGSNGSVTRLPTGSPVALRDVAIDITNNHNAIEARIPRSLMGRGSKIRVWAATGLWDAGASEWMAGQPGPSSAVTPGGASPAISARAFNVAFRRNETGSFMEERQAQALAAGDIEPFSAGVDLKVLAAGRDRRYKVKPGRFYVAIMDQRLTIPPYREGVSYDGRPGRFAGIGSAALSQTFEYYGRHQPYGLYVPSTYGRRRRIPAAFALHGHGGSHSTYNSQPGFLRDMGEGDGSSGQPPMFLITPLARGSSMYADWGEADTLAVLRDVKNRFPIDGDRFYLTGYSMGGYGVYRLGSLYPDLFAAAASWAGYTGEYVGTYLTNPGAVVDDPTGQSGAVSRSVREALQPLGVGGGRQGKANVGNPVDTLENLRHLPLVHLAGTNDQIVPVSGQYAAARRLAELGYRSRFDLFPGYEHYSFALVDDWKQVRAWLGNRTREKAPREVTYRFSDGWTEPGLARRLGIAHGNAWWLRDATMRTTTTDALTFASVDARSLRMPARAVSVSREMGPAEAPTPHLQQLVSWKEGARLPLKNQLDLRLAGVGGVLVDLDRARLDACGLAVALSSDGPATVRLAGPVSSAAVVQGDPSITARPERDALILKIAKAVTALVKVRC
jgi:dienelactone hydrolase